MNRPFFKWLLIFSLALNIAVAGTLVWHFWAERGPAIISGQDSSTLTPSDFRQIKEKWSANSPERMWEIRQRILDKNREIVELIAKNPDNPKAAEKAVKEMIALRAEAERRALQRISAILAGLPPDKREAFVSFLKNRACMGPGMGRMRGPMHQFRHMGPGRHGMWGR